MSDCFRPVPSVVHEQFDDETVIVNLETGCYFNLQGAAVPIWTLAVAGFSEAQVLERLQSAYGGEREAIGREASAFLAKLVEERLLERTTARTPSDVDVPAGAYASPLLHKYTDMEEALQLDPIHDVDTLGWPVAKPKVA